MLTCGTTAQGRRYDTWLFDGATWQEAHPTTQPQPPLPLSMVDDPLRRRVLLWSPDAAWDWDGAEWTAIAAPAPNPTGATAQSTRLAFDPLHGRPVHLGFDGTLSSFDGATWSVDLGRTTPLFEGTPDLAWDPARQAVMTLALGVSWHYDGLRWFEQPTTHSPGNRAQYVLATDTRRTRVLLFGGADPRSGLLADGTWEWNGADWSAVPTSRRPSPRLRSAMIEDEARGEILLFGGQGSNLLDDTWTFDGVEWTERTPAHRPPARAGHGMTFDPVRGVVVLFGGNGTTLADTWEWDGDDWREISTPPPSPSRGGRTLAFDPVRRDVLLHGANALGTPATLSFDGTTWTDLQIADTPNYVLGRRMISDPRREVLVALTVYDDALLEYSTSSAAAITPFGTGCAGGAGAPLLVPLGNSRPVLGAVLDLEFGPLPVDSTAIGVLGTSATTVNGLPLPFDLAGLGAPGCALLVANEVSDDLPLLGTIRPWSIAIPAMPALSGYELFAQGAALDPTANALGLVVSNGLALRLGIR